METIQLSGRHSDKLAIVDDDLLAELSKYNWHYHDGYASTNIKRKTVYMHRLVANTPMTMHTDHLNGDKLDNRRSNLVPCDRFQNMQNIHKANKRRGCIKKQVINGSVYWYGELRIAGARHITTTCENEEQAKGALKQIIKDKNL